MRAGPCQTATVRSWSSAMPRPFPAGLTTLFIVAPAFAAGAACTLIVTTSSHFGTAVARAPLVYAWVTMLAAQGAIAWAGLAPTAWLTLATWRTVSKTTRGLLVATAGVLVALLTIYSVLEPRAGALPHVQWPLEDEQTSRVAMLSAIICIPPTLAVVAMWLTAAVTLESPTAVTATKLPAAAAAVELPPRPEPVEPEVDAVARYLGCRERLHSLLWFVGIVVGCVVLSTGVLRQTMLDAKGATSESYPSSLVLAYGAFFTLVLLVSYVPAFVLMRIAGHRILSVLLASRLADKRAVEASDPSKKTPDLAVWSGERKQLIELLGLDIGLDTTLKNTVAILAPLAAGFASMALPGK